MANNPPNADDDFVPDITDLHRFDGRRLIKESTDIFMHSYYKQFLPDIEKILAVSKDRSHYKDPHKHLGLQFGVLQLLQQLEKASSEGNRLARKDGDKELALQSRRNRYIAKAYKEIADGIAWRTLGYPRFSMRILGQGVYSGHTWGKDAGQTAELRRAATAASNGVFVLINDVTNCLRIGDLTALPEGKGGHISLAEIKRKELITAHTIAQKIDKSRALDVQEERLIQAQLALDEKVMPMLSQNVPVVPIVPTLHDAMAGAGGVMKKAMQAGISSKMVTPYMHVDALDLAVLAELGDADALKAMLDANSPPQGLEPIMQFSNYDRLVHTAAGQLVRSTPPYTVYPLPLKVITKLITGELFMTTTIYRQPLEAAFKALGWEFRVDRQAIDAYESSTDDDYTADFSGRVLFPYDKPNSYNEMLWLRNPKTGFNMPAGDLVMQMGTEFTTARYAASVARAMEVIATPERPKASYKYPDLQDGKRWN